MKMMFRSIWSRILLILFVLYSLSGFVILPYLIQSNFTKTIKNTLNTNAYLNRVYINPFTFEVSLHKLLVQDNNNQTLLYFKSLETNLEFLSLARGVVQLDFINIDELRTNITFYKNQEFNFSHIITKLQETPTKEDKKEKIESNKSSLLFAINTFLLKNAQINFTDKTKSQDFSIKTEPFDFKINDFSTEQKNIARLETNIQILDTVNLDLSSNIMLTPIQVDGNINLTNLKFIKVYKYLEDDLAFRFAGIAENISSNFQIDVDNNSTQAKLQKLDIKIPSFNYKDENYTLNVKEINHTVKDISIEQNNLLTFLVKDIKLNTKNIAFKDALKNKDQALNFKDLSFHIDRFSSNKKENSNLLFSLKTPNSGDIDTNLNIKQQPLSIQGIVTTKSIDIVPYKEYIKEFINLDLRSTILDTQSKIDIQDSKQNIHSNIIVSDIDIYHNLTNKQLLQMKTFNIKDLEYRNNNLIINNILLDSFSTSFKIANDKSTNIDGLTIDSTQTTDKNNEEEKENSSKDSFNYYIKNIEISNGKAEFSDHSLPLNFDTKIHSLHANINDLSSKNKETNIKLQGTIDKYGLANINAKSIISDYKDKTKVSVNFENLDVRSFSPYSGKFIGQKIADGRLWLDLNYNISQAKLSSTNNIKIKNLTLGEDVESPEAMSLPVGLAIALLEDSEGLIELDVPVKGDMENPEFELSGVIWKTLGNVITNIVTAPFRFLGSLLGMDSDELGTIEFNFATAELLPPQIEKLDKLIGLFQKKTNLTIVLQPTINILKDSLHLKNIKYELLIKAEDKNAMIEKVYLERFGEENLIKLKKESSKDTLLDTLAKNIKETINISKEELNTLAYKRVQNIETYLLSHKLTLDRIQINKDVFENKDNETKELSLKLELNIKD